MALDCPTGATVPELDGVECATEGLDRPGPFVVRKSHFILTNEVGGDPIPRPHHLAWQNLQDEKIIFIYRDPRDIAVSGAHYYRITLQQMIYNMVHGAGELTELGAWHAYMEQWLDAPFKVTYISYEALKAAPVASLIYVLTDMGLSDAVDRARIEAAVEYHSFANTKRRIADGEVKYNRGREFNYWFLRSGQVGDWREAFELDDCMYVYWLWHPLLLRLSYEEDICWCDPAGVLTQDEMADLIRGAHLDQRYRPGETCPFDPSDVQIP